MKSIPLKFTILTFFFSFVTQSAFALTCAQVRQLAAVYLKFHYSFNHFDDELSSRTLEQYIKSWDPGKLYFYQSDIDQFRSKYSKKIDDQVMAANCEAIDEIVNVYSKRFEERQKAISKLIAAQHDFKIDEYLELDRKKIEFAKDEKELTERWRQRVKFQLLQLKKTLKDNMKEARSKLQKRYKLATKRHQEQSQEEIYARFLNAFASSLDPHSDYMSAEQLEDFRISTRLSLEGIGAVLRSEDGFTVVQSVVPGGAASKTGELKVDDKIIAVSQETGSPVDVIDMDLRDVVKLIRGTGGTKVKLTIVREQKGQSKQLEVTIVREKIQLTDRTAKAETFDVEVEQDGKAKKLKVGVLNLPSFYIDFEGQHSKLQDYRSSARDMQRELEELKKKNTDALVIDLRSNGGGSLTESIKVAGMFFDKGPVVQIKESDDSVYPHSDSDNITFWDGPLVVLISRQSASASEIFAGAIQDYERGLIVGDDHTFGKGTVQNLNDIGAKLGATKVTISKFYRPSGSSTQHKGVESDIEFPSLLKELEVGEKHYDYSLAWDKIKATPFKRFNQVTPYLDTLKSRSSSRIKNDPGYKELMKEIEEWRKNKAESSRVSLSESKQDSEKDKAEELAKEMEAEAGREKIVLKDDIHLQEAVRVAADYATLLDKKSLGLVKIPQIDDAPKIAETKKGKNGKSVAETKSKEVKEITP